MAAKLRLVYFNIKGRAEIIRLLLYAAGVNFVDDRIEFSDWPQVKDETPNGTLPYIEYQGRQIGEALPIARFLARKYKMMGKDELQQLDCDVILNRVDILRMAGARCAMDSMLTEAQKKDLKKAFIEEKVPTFMQMMEEMLEQSSSGFLVGESMTIADLALYDAVDSLLVHHPELLDSYPTVAEHKERVESMPKLATYLEQRQYSDR